MNNKTYLPNLLTIFYPNKNFQTKQEKSKLQIIINFKLNLLIDFLKTLLRS